MVDLTNQQFYYPTNSFPRPATAVTAARGSPRRGGPRTAGGTAGGREGAPGVAERRSGRHRRRRRHRQEEARRHRREEGGLQHGLQRGAGLLPDLP